MLLTCSYSWKQQAAIPTHDLAAAGPSVLAAVPVSLLPVSDLTPGVQPSLPSLLFQVNAACPMFSDASAHPRIFGSSFFFWLLLKVEIRFTPGTASL